MSENQTEIAVSDIVIHDIAIQDIAFGGSGVARSDGKVIFVPFTIDGEKVTARIVNQKKKFANGELISVETASPERVAPPCLYFGKCGGCSYQHISYAHQLEIKSRQVEQTLRRIGKLSEVPMRPIIPSPDEYGFRNRIRVHVADGVVGFYRHDRHELLDIETCAIAAPGVNRALGELRSKSVPDGDYSLTESHDRFFEQTNNAVAKKMRELAATYFANSHRILIDAYCGTGFFAHTLAPHFEQVIGIEENEFAISEARHLANPNERYIAGDVSYALGSVLTRDAAAETALILDPPALGIEPRVADLILAAPPAEILYVSCNPATLARDLAALSPAYHLESVTPLDMFPQTAEIECIAHLKLRQIL